jgi:hypothetical protein
MYYSLGFCSFFLFHFDSELNHHHHHHVKKRGVRRVACSFILKVNLGFRIKSSTLIILIFCFCRAFVRILCVCCPRRMRRRYQPALRSKPSQVRGFMLGNLIISDEFCSLGNTVCNDITSYLTIKQLTGEIRMYQVV